MSSHKLSQVMHHAEAPLNVMGYYGPLQWDPRKGRHSENSAVSEKAWQTIRKSWKNTENHDKTQNITKLSDLGKLGEPTCRTIIVFLTAVLLASPSEAAAPPSQKQLSCGFYSFLFGWT